jgi:LysM repeat protein
MSGQPEAKVLTAARLILLLLGIGILVVLAKALVLDPRRASSIGLPLQAIQATATAQVRALLSGAHPTPSPAPQGQESGGIEAAPQDTPVPEETPTLVPEPTPTPQPEEYYEVQPGDTLSKIAARFGTTADEIARLNGLADPNRISVGQRLRVR